MPDPIWSQLLLQLVLILVNAFFASAEIAVISLNEQKLKKLSESGDKKSEKLLKMVENPEGFLSTIQIGITLAGFLASAFAADNFAGRLCDWLVNDLNFTAVSPDVINSIAVVVITLILSYFTLVFGELVPKRVAMKKSERIARMASGIVRFISVVMKPAIWLLSASTNIVLRMMGFDPNEQDEEVTEEEIRLMVDAGQESGSIEATEKEMIENVFEFNNITAADAMTHRTEMTALQIDESDEYITNAIVDTGFSRFPVYEEDIDKIIGILSTRQFLLNRQKENPKPLRELLYSPYFVPETVRADILFRDMQKKKFHMAIVLDEYGGTAGVITMEDLLETIVGNIYDEFDPQDEQDIIKLDENSWRIAGSVELERVEEELGVDLGEELEEYDTIGGLIFGQFSVIPDDGSKPETETHNLKIQIESISEHRIEWAIVSVKKDDSENSSDDDDAKE